jgi:hypothetical protein
MIQNIVIAANTNAQDFKIVAYEVTTPNTAVDDVIINAPHTVSQTASFLTLNDVAHIFRLYEWNGSTLGALLSETVIQANKESIKTPDDIELVVGIDLTINGTQWDGSVTYPDFAGYKVNKDYRIVQRSVGPLKSSEVTDYGTFGFELQGGQIFSDGDTYFIEFIPKLLITPNNGGTTSINGFKDVISIGTDLVLDSSSLNKLIDINRQLDAVAPTIELPPIANWTDMSSIGFAMNQGLQVNAIIKLATGETIWFNNLQVNDIVVGMNEYIKITKKGTDLYVESTNINYNNVGKVENGVRVTNNTIIGEGQLLLRNIYVRLWRMVQSLSNGNGLVSEATWSTSAPDNQFNYTTGDLSTNFRVPNYRGVTVRYLDGGRGLDADRVTVSQQNTVGSYQRDMLEMHKHRIGYLDGVSGGVGGYGRDTGESIIGYGISGVGSGGDRALTDKPSRQVNANNTSYTRADGSDISGIETRMKNVGLLPLINI